MTGALAWASYNAGLGRIYSALKKGYTDFWSMAGAPGKRVLRPETKGYVPKLMAAAIIAKHPEAFGFRDEELEKESWTDYTEVEIPSATLLSVVARAAKVDERDLIDLNPELRRSCTPPHAYALKIPTEAGPIFTESWPAVQSTVKTTFVGHTIHRGDTLSKVATEYGVPVEGIVDLNNLRGRRLKVGSEILIPRPVSGGQLAARSPEDGTASLGERDAAPSDEAGGHRGRPCQREGRADHAAGALGRHPLVDLPALRSGAHRSVPLERDQESGSLQAAERQAARGVRRSGVVRGYLAVALTSRPCSLAGSR